MRLGRSNMKNFGFVFLLGIVSSLYAQKPSVYYPSAKNWEHKVPSFFNLDTAKLNDAIRFAQSMESSLPKNLWLSQAMQYGKEPFSDPIGPMADRGPAAGLVIYKGYIVAEWGNPSSVEMTHSVTKSILSSVVGLAYDKGLISSLDDKVYTYLPPVEVSNMEGVQASQNPIAKTSFIYPFETEHNRKISWEHLLRQTSDWEGVLWGKPDWADRPSDKIAEWTTRARFEPGTVYKYNDTRVNALALATTLVWRKPLPEVLRENIMNPIGASNTWAWTGYKNAWIVMDGKLVQSVSGGGHFGGGMFINAYDMARLGLLTLRKGNWNGKQILSEDWIKKSMTPGTANAGYGFMNYFLNTDRKLYPSAPATAYAHIGNGTNAIYVDSENDIVLVARWIEDKSLDGLIQRVLGALPTKK
ncbi:MAG: serine hydrolase domain-containing protein [Aquirufa sp.]